MKSKLLLTAFFCLVLVTLISSGQQPPPSVKTWSFLNDSFWYVPEANIKAILTAPNSPPLPITDQTVFFIEKYVDGYFWGITAVQLTNIAPKLICFQLVGSVTPEGQVNLTFTPTSS